MDKKILMIGVSTAQNTTNVLPALQMKIDYFIALETSAAHKRNWSDGMTSVLKKKGITVLNPIILDKTEDTRIDLISKRLSEIIPANIEILWNLGGGQKAQQFAMWQTFISRNEEGKDEIACYANPENQKLEIWEYNFNTKKPEFSSVNIESILTAAEVFEIYGYRLDVPESSVYYSKLKKNNYQPHKLHELLNYHEFRKFFYKLPKTSHADESNQKNLTIREFEKLAKQLNDSELELFIAREQRKRGRDENFNIEKLVPTLRKKIINNIKKLFLTPPKDEKIKIFDNNLKNTLKSITGINNDFLEVSYTFFKKNFPGYSKISFLFEDMLKEITAEILNDNNNYVLEAYSNIKLYKGTKNIAEYDILFVTTWGTIIAIDAKTYDVAVKDIDARLLNLRQGAGRYVKFIISYPFYPDDIDKLWLPAEIKRLSSKLIDYNIPFYTFNNISQTTTLLINGKEIIFKPINKILEDLKLIRI